MNFIKSLEKKLKFDRKYDTKKLYLMNIPGTNHFKIGVSDKPNRRVKQVSNSSGFNVKLVRVLTVPDAFVVEQICHEVFKHKRINGEWFEFNVDLTNRIKCDIEYFENLIILLDLYIMSYRKLPDSVEHIKQQMKIYDIENAKARQALGSVYDSVYESQYDFSFN